MKVLIYICAIFFAFSTESFAAASPATLPADTLLIKSILFMGNDKTKDHILAREMQIREGDYFNAQAIEQARQRIENLQLFTKVEIQPLLMDGGITLLVMVSERWYFFPYPVLYINERDWKKWSYGAGVFHQNIAGRNISVSGAFWLGYNPGIQLNYRNPWVGGDRKLSVQSTLFSGQVRNKNSGYENFDEKHMGGSFALGKRWGFHTFLTGQVGYRRVQIPRAKALAAAADGIDHLPRLDWTFIYDFRDLHAYPKRGWYLKTYWNKIFFNQQVDLTRYGIDMRRYQPLFAGLSLAGRYQVDFSHGLMPAYDRFFFGYTERIRGHFSDHLEGEQRMLASLELRFPILSVRHFNLDDGTSLLGGYMSNLPFGISGGIFMDTGAVWMQNTALHKRNFLSGWGLGLHFHVPYAELLRFECAVNGRGDLEFITDLGVWF